jgi:cation transport ATPase
MVSWPNGEAALCIQAVRLPVDSRYARIMQVMQQSQQQRPHLRRLGDQLGAFYTPLAVAIALTAWLISGELSVSWRCWSLPRLAPC